MTNIKYPMNIKCLNSKKIVIGILTLICHLELELRH